MAGSAQRAVLRLFILSAAGILHVPLLPRWALQAVGGEGLLLGRPHLLVAAQTKMSMDELDVRRIRCKPKKRPSKYEPIDSLPSAEFEPCAEQLVEGLLLRDVEVVDISTVDLSEKNKVVMLAEKQGALHQVNVIAEGERADWDLQQPAMRSFAGHSCLSTHKFCDLVSVDLTQEGFWTVDRHRITSYAFGYSSDTTEVVVGQHGHFNTAAKDEAELNYPTNVAFYRPLNATHITEGVPVTPVHADAGSTFMFASDTGNHRVSVFKLPGGMSGGKMERIGHFGVTGSPRHNATGLHWPHGVAVAYPAVEINFDPVFANVFVADRRNNRVVKLNLGYPSWEDAFEERGLTLLFSGAYGGRDSGLPHEEDLQDPVAVSVFRHYIVVAEGLGNVVKILKVHHSRLDELVLITRLWPAQGIQLTGHLSVTPKGYIWYTYKQLPSSFGVASIFLTEVLRESPPREMIEDVISQCQNDTWYHSDVLLNHSMYYSTVGYLLNATRTNWLWPHLPGFFDVQRFNLTYFFDLPTLNETIFNGRMTFCKPPDVSTTPAMLSADGEGWAGQDGGLIRGAAPGQRPTALQLYVLALAVTALLSVTTA